MSRSRTGFASLILFALIGRADPAIAASFSVSGIKASRFLVSPGETVLISAQVKNTGLDRAEGVNVVLSLGDPFGNEFPGSEQIVAGQTFNPNQRRPYRLQWRAPDDLTPGLYSISIGVFSSDWSQIFALQTRGSAFAGESDELSSSSKLPA